MARPRLASKSFGVYSLGLYFSFEVFTTKASPSLPRQVKVTRAMGAAMRRIQAGSALSAFGIGFTVPFLYVYVAQVRDLGASTAGIVLAGFAMAALIVLPVTGRVIDRRGPLPVLVGAAAVASVGAVALGLANSEPTAILAAALLGAGTAVMQPALATMIVWSSTPATRTRSLDRKSVV